MQKIAAVDLIGVGLNATDTVVQIGEFPTSGAKVEYTDERVMPGGQVATTVVACQSWGMTTRMVGRSKMLIVPVGASTVACALR